METLAIKYRPKVFEDVCEQHEIVAILENQIKTDTQKHAYLFVGPAGCGKTTCARIFSDEVNKGGGTTIELDAASNNGVDDIRNIIEAANKKPITGRFKTFIIDECHSLSNSAWQALLKVLEEPPATAIFLLCTTDPSKIPDTIISRVQRFDFGKMSRDTIVARLEFILNEENKERKPAEQYAAAPEAVEHIAKLAEGGMRAAISMLDQCLSSENVLTLEKVLEVLGATSYDCYFQLMEAIFNGDHRNAVALTEQQYANGIDLKKFMKGFQSFLLDVCKFKLFDSFDDIMIPNTDQNAALMESEHTDDVIDLLHWCATLNNLIKWEADIRPVVVTEVLLKAVVGDG